MTATPLLQVGVFLGLVVLMTPAVGWWIHAVFERRRTPVDRVLGPVERAIYRLCGIDPTVEMRAVHYALSLLAFNFIGLAVLYAQLRLQGILPFNPLHVPGMRWDTALNTAVSFVTNTNWQSYAGETAVSPFTQMTGLALQQFLSAATGLCVGVALVRGIVRSSANRVGNFWADLTRSWLYILLPAAFVLALVYVGQGTVQTLGTVSRSTTLQGTTQTVVTGPVASMEAIKELGTNGGGYFNANSAHPFEGPTPLAVYLQALTILLLPAGLTSYFGRMTGDRRQGWVVFSAMMLLLVLSIGVTIGSEQASTPTLARAGVATAASAGQPGGNMEGKEVRFGIVETSLFASITTAVSNGAVVGMHDSFTPLGGGSLLLNMLLGETIFGGVGVGLAGMLVYAILAVFIAGLMVGRTPEYVGKKIESKEVRMAMFAVLAVNFAVLVPSAISFVTRSGLAGRLNAGPHGFTEILYAFASAAGNNGSALAGLAANTPYYNVATAIAIFAGRFFFILPVLAIAGSLSAKRRLAESAGTLPTNNGLFVGLLTGVVVIVGALTFFPALALGPIVEHLLMLAGRLF
jgi:K+-transporting ATPase ATPase A chain